MNASGRESRCAQTVGASMSLFLAALLATALLASPPTHAQDLPGMPGAASEPAAPTAVEATSADAVAARAQAAASELAATDALLARAVDDAQRAHLAEVRDELVRIETILRKQVEQLEAAAAATPEVEPVQPPSDLGVSVLALNALYEQQFDAEEQRSRLARAETASRDALQAAKSKFEEAERARREARAAFEAASAGALRSAAERTLELRRLASRSAQERVHLRTLEAQSARRKLDAVLAPASFDAAIAELRKALAAGEGDATGGLDALAGREGELNRERRALDRRLSSTELRLEAAKTRYARQSRPSKELLEEVEALSTTRDALRQAVALVDARLERIAGERTLASQWSDVLQGGGTRDEYEAAKQVIGERIDSLTQLEAQLAGQRADLERRLDALKRRLERLPAESELAAVLEEQRATLSELISSEQTQAGDLARERRLAERVRQDLRAETGEIDLISIAKHSAQAGRDFWTYELTAVEDSPITVGSLVLALLLASAGLWASRRGSRLFGNISRKRFKLDAGAAQALETLSFYVLLASFTMLALRAVHFPLTAFTVLGGALAIGIGFGSQNVMNNFISGLILMLERPVRAGDVVEVDSNHGTIERIGARSTQIRSTDGRHIVVPNSFFLENNVVNWTLSDDLVRTSVVVGVTYGSPTRLVEELIKKVADEDPAVLSHPLPVILFNEFGDNSLNFEVHFWVTARSPMEMRKVQSALRFRIDELFRENEIVIAFPQRDVHLDTLSPLEVRVVSQSGSSPDKGQK